MSNNNDYSDHGDIINLHHNDDNDDDIHDNDDNDVAATNPTSSNARAPVLWSDAEIRVLIDERRERNFEYYYLIPGRSRTGFWGSVVTR